MHGPLQPVQRSVPCEHAFVQQSKGTPHGRFQRAVERRNVLAAESAARELGSLSLRDALALTVLLAEREPRRFDRAAVRWHGRFELELRGVSLLESQFALAALASLRGSQREQAARTLRALLERRRDC